MPAGVQFYGVTHKPLINVDCNDRPDDPYVVIGALDTGDPILFKKGSEQISIYNQEPVETKENSPKQKSAEKPNTEQQKDRSQQKKTNVRKFISVVKKYTDMTQLDATILREFVEQIRVSDTYTTDEQQKRVKIREIEIVYNFIGAFDFEGAREQSQTAQDKNNAKVGAA